MEASLQIANYLPLLQGREAEYATEAIQSGWVSYGGPYVSRFEKEVAQRLGFPEAVTMGSGTCALQIGLEVLELRDTEILMPALTFAAPASAIVRAGAVPVLIDLDPHTWQMDAGILGEFLNQACNWDGHVVINRTSGRRVSAICIVHLYGSMANLDAVYGLASRYRLAVIHDSAQCFGATYHGRPLGAVPAKGVETIIAATSFNANKIITTGAGGALFSNRPELSRRARHLASTAKTNPYSFDHDALGVNYRLSNVAAALGVGQLEQMDHFIATKRSNDELYRALISETIEGAVLECREAGVESNYWMFCFKVDSPTEPTIRRLQEKGVQARPLWIPLRHLAPYTSFEYIHHQDVSESLWKTGMMLPSGANLTESDVRAVVRALRLCLSL